MTSDSLRAAHALGLELLGAMAASLGLPERTFADSVADDPFAVLRLNRYPPQPEPAEGQRAGPAFSGGTLDWGPRNTHTNFAHRREVAGPQPRRAQARRTIW